MKKKMKSQEVINFGEVVTESKLMWYIGRNGDSYAEIQMDYAYKSKSLGKVVKLDHGSVLEHYVDKGILCCRSFYDERIPTAKGQSYKLIDTIYETKDISELN